MDLKSILSRLFNMTAQESAHAIEEVGNEMTGGTGFLSFRRRFRIKRGDSTINLFLKLSDTGRQDLGHLKEFSDHFCPRECVFYGCLAPLLERTATQVGLGSIGLPVVHHELVQPTGTLLVMEDLCDAGFSLAPYAMSSADARCVLGCLARLQAAFWLTRARLGLSANGLFDPDSPLADALGSISGSGVQFQEFLSNGFEVFRREFPKYLSSKKRVSIINAYLDDGFLDKAHRIIKAGRDEREVIGLTHSDLWYNNCMIRRDSHGQPLDCRLLDWQFFGIGALAYDFGPLWVSSIDNAIATEEFVPCVEFFYESIRSLYEDRMQEKFPVTLDQMKHQAIQSLHWGVVWVVLSAETLWAFESVKNLLANVADMIEHFKL